MKKSEKAREYREKNKEIIAEKKKEWRKKNADRIREQNKKWREKNVDKIKEYYQKSKEKNIDKIKEYNKIHKRKLKESNPEKWLQVLLSNCRIRHKKNDYSGHIICEITLEDLIAQHEKQKGLCAISNVKMDHIQGSLNSISIDRIDNNLGYTKENTHLVAKWINIGRRNATLEEIKQAIKDLINANKATVT